MIRLLYSVLLLAFLVLPGTGYAGTLIEVTTTVDELADDGDCSLREAIEAANTDAAVDACPAGNGQDTILVPAGTYVLSICGDREEENKTGDLDILDDLTLIGAGPGSTILDGGSDVCGKVGLRKCRWHDDSDRVLDVHPGITADISLVTITHGRVCRPFSHQDTGGGVRNRGDLTLHDSEVKDNEVVGATGRFVFAVGGGVANVAYVGNATTTLNSCLIVNNAAQSAGAGGVANIVNTGLKAETTVNASIIRENTAQYAAGGLGNYYVYERQGIATDAECSMTINDSLIEGNKAGGGGGIGGAGRPGGEGDVRSTLTVNHSMIRGNAVTAGGDYQGYGGGLYAGDTMLEIRNSTFEGNSATCEGFDYCGGGGGVFALGGLATVEGSTFSHNWATAADGIGGVGGGVGFEDGTFTVINSTISGNRATQEEGKYGGFGGGIVVFAGFSSRPATLELVNSTIADNSASWGGGGLAAQKAADFDLEITFFNSLLGGNSAPTGTESCFREDVGYGLATFTSQGNNLENFDLCEFDFAGDLPNTDPLLSELADNGGPTETHALLPGSPAIDAGNDATAPDTDQRGVPRPQGPASDIGAYEVE